MDSVNLAGDLHAPNRHASSTIAQKLPMQEKSAVDLAALPDTLSKDEIDRLLSQAEVELVSEPLSANNIRRAVAQFDKRIKKNQEERMKYLEEPEKWIKSEVDLDEEIKKFKYLAAVPSLYDEFVKLNGASLLVSLLNHSNEDIAIEVIDVLSELTDPDVVAESSNPEEFLDALFLSQLPELSIDAILRINEDGSDEEYQGISNALQVLENLIDMRPSICSKLCKIPKFFYWLLKRIRQSSRVDFNRVFASEILGIVLQNSPEIREIIGQKGGIDGIDKLLRSIALYRKKDPENSEEEELVQNLFDCLCNLMLVPEHQLTFGKFQGLELMIRMMRERKFACRLALRLTDFALSNCPANCKIFVEKLGLKVLFSLFMKKGLKTKKGSATETEDEEHTIAAIQSLSSKCTGIPLARVLNKFTENSFEKVERLIELHERYQFRVNNNIVASGRKELHDIDMQLDINEKEQQYLDRCEHGLFIVQQVDNIIIRLCNMGNTLVSERVCVLLHNKGIPPLQIKQNISEYCESLDQSAEEEYKILTSYLENFLVLAQNVQQALEER